MVLAERLRKRSSLALAVLLLFASIAPAIVSKKVGAYNLVTSRSIQLSNSADGTLTAGQNVIYRTAFTTGSAHDIQSVAVQFCSNSPIIGDTCNAPTGFDVQETNLTVNTQSGLTGFSIHANTSANRVVLTRSSTGSISAGTAVIFELGNGTNGIRNPNGANTTFYARILTYTAADGTGTEVDAGGIALSTAQQITVTSKVQERLSFCVYGADATGYANNNCTSKSSTGAITLGDTNGVLDPAGAYVTKAARYSVSTNASGNVAIRMKGPTLTSGGNTISAIGGGTAEAASSPGNEQFGICTYQFAGSGLTPDAGYDGSSGAPVAECSGTTETSGTGTPGGDNSALFAFNSAGTSSTYGSTIASKSAGDYSTGSLVFIGNIGNTTEAGIYTTTLTFIATGTY